MDMTNEIDKKIQSAIEQQAGYSLSVFRTRFNDGTMDAVMVFRDVHSTYGRYMTRDYCTTILGLNKWKIQQFFQGKLIGA